MKKASGSLTIKGKQCFGAVQAETKGRMEEMLQTLDKQITKAFITTYWSNEWGRYAEYSIGDTEEEGVWITDGMGVRNAKTFKKVV